MIFGFYGITGGASFVPPFGGGLATPAALPAYGIFQFRELGLGDGMETFVGRYGVNGVVLHCESAGPWLYPKDAGISA